MRNIAVLTLFSGLFSLGALAGERDEAWCRFRGPAHGRAHVAAGPKLPLRLDWRIDLWANGDLFSRKKPWNHNAPLGIGVAWRVDDRYLYGFEQAFYTRTGRDVALFDRRTGALVHRFVPDKGQPLANKRAASIHDDPGFGLGDAPLLFFGNFYAGHRLLTVREDKIVALDERALNVRMVGHTCEGARWLKGRYYLDGGGAPIKEKAWYRWGSNLCRWAPRDKSQKRQEIDVVLRDVSVPCTVWNDRDLVLFVRGGLTEPTANGVFAWQEYVRIRDDQIVARLRVRLFEDRPPAGQRIINLARNAVRAMAISPDGKLLYCHERIDHARQQFVVRRMSDFELVGKIPPAHLPRVQNTGFAAQTCPELGIGFAVDAAHFYLHLRDRLELWTPDLKTRLKSIAVRPRTLNAASSFAMNRYDKKGGNASYPARGTENTIATDGVRLYLTTDTTLQVHDAKTGKELWVHEFERHALPALGAEAGLPGDVIVCPDAVYVATHRNQSVLFRFVPASAK